MLKIAWFVEFFYFGSAKNSTPKQPRAVRTQTSVRIKYIKSVPEVRMFGNDKEPLIGAESLRWDIGGLGLCFVSRPEF